MAAFDHIKDMYDVALKPRLLHTLIRDHVPDNKHPFGSPLDLSKVVYTIKTHNLLRESVQDLTFQKLINNWRSTIDSCVNHLMELIVNDIPDKCWAGICLLGVTCQECSYERFLESYSGWFQKHLPHIQRRLLVRLDWTYWYCSRLDWIVSVGYANLTAWCSGPRGCALTRDVLLLNAVRLCAGVPARSTVRRDGDEVWVEDGGAPTRCSENDGHMIYGVNEMITEMVLQRLENQGSLELSIYRGSPGGTIEAEKICVVEPDWGKWVVKSSFGIVKHGGVTPINSGKSRPPPWSWVLPPWPWERI
ncbi:unnamed protein product [Prunus armeniaca]